MFGDWLSGAVRIGQISSGDWAGGFPGNRFAGNPPAGQSPKELANPDGTGGQSPGNRPYGGELLANAPRQMSIRRRQFAKGRVRGWGGIRMELYRSQLCNRLTAHQHWSPFPMGMYWHMSKADLGSVSPSSESSKQARTPRSCRALAL